MFIDEGKKETVDLSRRGLKKIEKAPAEESKTIINLILDQNELQRLDNIDSYNRVENVSHTFRLFLLPTYPAYLSSITFLFNLVSFSQINLIMDFILLKELKLYIL